MGAAGSGVGGAEEEDAVGAGVDGVEVCDFGCGAAHGVCECLSRVSIGFLMLGFCGIGVLFSRLCLPANDRGR